MAVPGFYRRVLPSPPAISFASPEGKQIFREALLQGTMEGFFTLSSCFQTQAEPAYCGLATLSVVLNALAIDPGRTWKGPWRWFDEAMLDCCEPLERVQREGIVFPKVACLARCNGALVRESRADLASEAEFRMAIRDVASCEDRHLIVSYSRKTFQQTGDGHFSPVGGYHAERDLALILDVARFKYPPHWVPISLLWQSMNALDKGTGRPRGFMVVSRRDDGPTMLFTLTCQDPRWGAMAEYLTRGVPHMLASGSFDSAEEVVQRLVASMPAPPSSLVAVIAEMFWEDLCTRCENANDTSHLFLRSNILMQLRALEIHGLVMPHIRSASLPSPPVSEQHFVAVDGSGEMASAESIPPADLVQSKHSCSSTGSPSARVPVAQSPENGAMAGGVAGCCQGSREEENKGVRRMRRPGEGDLATVLLLACAPEVWDCVRAPGVAQGLRQLVDVQRLSPALRGEVIQLRNQLMLLRSEPVDLAGNL